MWAKARRGEPKLNRRAEESGMDLGIHQPANSPAHPSRLARPLLLVLIVPPSDASVAHDEPVFLDRAGVAVAVSVSE